MNIQGTDEEKELNICIISQEHKYYTIDQTEKIIDFLKFLYKLLTEKIPFKEANGTYTYRKYSFFLFKNKKMCIKYDTSENKFKLEEHGSYKEEDCDVIVQKFDIPVIGRRIQFILEISNENKGIKYICRMSKGEFQFKLDTKLSVVIEKGFPFFMETFAIINYNSKWGDKYTIPAIQIIESVNGISLNKYVEDNITIEKNVNEVPLIKYKNGDTTKNEILLIYFQALLVLELFFKIFDERTRDMHNENIIVYECNDNKKCSNNQKFIINGKTYEFNCGYNLKLIDITSDSLTYPDYDKYKEFRTSDRYNITNKFIDFLYLLRIKGQHINSNSSIVIASLLDDEIKDQLMGENNISRTDFLDTYYEKYIKDKHPVKDRENLKEYNVDKLVEELKLDTRDPIEYCVIST